MKAAFLLLALLMPALQGLRAQCYPDYEQYRPTSKHVDRWIADAGVWQRYDSTAFRYDTAGRRLEWHHFRLTNAGWKPDYQATCRYDKNGQLESETTFRRQGQKWANRSRYVYRYDAADNRCERTLQWRKTLHWKNTNRDVTRRDAQGRDTLRTTYNRRAFRFWKPIAKIATSYAGPDERQISRMQFWRWENDRWADASLQIHDLRGGFTSYRWQKNVQQFDRQAVPVDSAGRTQRLDFWRTHPPEGEPVQRLRSNTMPKAAAYGKRGSNAAIRRGTPPGCIRSNTTRPAGWCANRDSSTISGEKAGARRDIIMINAAPG